MDRSPRLSVVIPCKDGGEHLPGALGSVLDQEGGPDLEVLLVEDAGADPSTRAVLDHYRGGRGPVRVVPHRRGPGPGAARNTGIESASGDWVAFLDSDDWWLPGGLAARWKAALRPGVHWVAGEYGVGDEQGAIAEARFCAVRPRPARQLREARREGSALVFPRPVANLLHTAFVWTGTILVERSLLRAAGGFDETLHGAEDVHLWLRLALHADLAFVEEPVAVYRQRTGSLTNRGSAPGHWDTRAMAKLLRDPAFGPWRPLIRRRMATFRQMDLRFHRERGEYAQAVDCALRGLARAPLRRKLWQGMAAALLRR